MDYIRLSKRSDQAEIMNIWLSGNLSAHFFIPESYWKNHYQDVYHEIENAEVWVYDKQGVKGFIGLINQGYIAGLFVEQKNRGKGIGTALLKKLQEEYTQLSLKVYVHNEKAVQFYRKNGFMITQAETDSDTNQAEYQMEWRKEVISSD